MSSGSNLSHRPDIDGLRAIAVLAVVAYHATKRVSGGFVGVDVFFVISGFLISGIILEGLQSRTFSLVEFYARRIRRIFPALILVLTFSWLVGWFVLDTKSYASLGQHIVAGAGFFSNILLWSESGYFDSSAAQKPLLHLWSLGIEEQFYLLWPLLLVVVAKFGRRIFFTICSLLTISFIVNILGVRSNAVAAFYLPLGRFWELLVGAMLAYSHLKYGAALKSILSTAICQIGKVKVSISFLCSILGLLLILVSIFVTNESSRFPGWWATLPVIGTFLLIAAGNEAIINKSVLSHKWLVAIGLISYPLYLWHWPLLTFARMMPVSIEHPRLTMLSMVGLAFVLSILTYRLVEKPLRFGVKWEKNLVAKGLLFSMILVGSLGALTHFKKGLTIRYPQAMRPFLNYEYDYRDSFRNTRCLLAGQEQIFAAECANVKAEVPVMLIWGDSHGAMLYRSLSEIAQTKGIYIAQFTSSSCPPILDFDKNDRPLCRAINDQIFKKIIDVRPATIVMAHDWPQSVLEGSIDRLPATIRRLRDEGVQRIIIVGPVPHWDKPLAEEVVKYIQSTNEKSVPVKLPMPMLLGESINAIDRKLSLIAKNESINYAAPLATFCQQGACLVTLESGGEVELTAFDTAHLTQIASQFFVEKNKNIFFPEIPKSLARH
jgi:peptidoglycan/LPS O-acetylase OafA/YrhL